MMPRLWHTADTTHAHTPVQESRGHTPLKSSTPDRQPRSAHPKRHSHSPLRSSPRGTVVHPRTEHSAPQALTPPDRCGDCRISKDYTRRQWEGPTWRPVEPGAPCPASLKVGRPANGWHMANPEPRDRRHGHHMTGPLANLGPVARRAPVSTTHSSSPQDLLLSPQTGVGC